ncbi:MAG: FAD-dependent oxidoreductase [Acidimicrobiia bacterium]|nr:FAD-dependent oxidoreductase [Acidimicrobiia bacterium]
MQQADIAICGAGIAGISTAFQLTRKGAGKIVLIDPESPMTVTSDKSSESYRNWWPSRTMVALIDRSIDLLEGFEEEFGIGLGRRGYLFATAESPDSFMADAQAISALGAGPLRIDEEYRGGDVPWSQIPPGADIMTEPSDISSRFPYLNDDVTAVLHARRAGWFDSKRYGGGLLESARDAGANVISDQVVAVEENPGGGYSVVLESGEQIGTEVFVNAAGPSAAQVAEMVGDDLPLFTELHTKVVFRDHLRLVPRDAPMLLWADRQRLDWDDEEREALATDPDLAYLLDELPALCHFHPEGSEESPWVVGQWSVTTPRTPPVFPIEIDPMYAEVVLRGLSTMIPRLAPYTEWLPSTSVDGGYYTRTESNHPLIGAGSAPGVFHVVGLGGFGLMASAAAGELAANWVVGADLPEYATALRPGRDEESLLEISGKGQL